ncbi:MAG: hypothetical protein L3J24_03580 [Xanthomonadales bacterium]|nr:hypothetical protein [Xanthomonadales bacterium]
MEAFPILPRVKIKSFWEEFLGQTLDFSGFLGQTPHRKYPTPISAFSR